MKIGASMLATEDRTIEEALEYFDSNKYIDYVEIVHDYPYREINDDNELIDLINSYDLKYTVHSPFIDVNIASLNPAVADFSVSEIERSIDLANMIDSNLVVVHPGILGFHGRGKEELVYKISEEHFTSTKLICLYCPFNCIKACINSSSGTIYVPSATINTSLGIYGNYNTLASKFISRIRN